MLHLKHTLKPVNFSAEHWNITCTAKWIKSNRLLVSGHSEGQPFPEGQWARGHSGSLGWQGKGPTSQGPAPWCLCKGSRADPETVARFNQAPRSSGKVTVMRMGQSQARMGLPVPWSGVGGSCRGSWSWLVWAVIALKARPLGYTTWEVPILLLRCEN